ncbi:ribonuclease H-like domain-containing protein [Tanacetum coccineum]
MDTGASSHLNDSVHSLSDVLNMCIYPSVSVSDGYSIPVTNPGHSILPTPHRPLHLNNVLITPNIVKNLIYVCQFVRDSNCTVEFDAYGFSIKDFMTRHVLPRCDSTGDLYPCDHGGEFDNHAFHKLFADNGIQFRFSCPRTSQQNGKSERMIRTINNIIRMLLFHAHLPLNYWVEALNMAIILLNILPSRAIDNEIPFTCLFGNTPDYSVLRTFRCLCYPHLVTTNKLEPRATPSIFLGHADHHRGYRCLDLNTNKIIISRHVTFDETVFPFGSMTPTSPPSYDFLDESNNLISNIIRSSPITNTKDPQISPAATNPTPQQTPLDDGTLSRYKACLVANVSTQIDGVDVDETFSPVVKPGTIRTVLSLATSRHWPVHQLDVKNAFLHGDLAETVYMHQPPGFRDSAHPDYVCLLQRSLYGLKGLTLPICFCISVMRDSSGMFLSQRKYATEIFERAHMGGCNSSRTLVDTESKLGDDGDSVSDPKLYRSLAGSLQYIRGTLDYGLQLFSSSTTSLVAYSDADWAGCPITRRSTSGYCVFLGNNLLLWSSKRQPTLSRSSAEAEYRGVANVITETCWLRNLLRELHIPLSSATFVYCDNVSAVYLSSNLVQHQRMKHIDIDIHFVRDLVAAGQVRVLHVPSRYQFADIFTKGLPSTLFEEFRTSLRVRCPPAPTAREC